MTQPVPHSLAPIVSQRAWPLLTLLAVAGTGCYRATGITRPTLVATEIPASGGDGVAGLKATASAGDFYLGNDFIALAVDGATWPGRKGQFEAPSGGAILDIGAINLDQTFKRVPVPSDLVDRLAPVINQDPDLPLVFDSIVPVTQGETSLIEMRGGVLDPGGKLGLPTANGRVIGLEVNHSISLTLRGRHFDIATTVINRTASPVPVYSIGDYLEQRGGAGYRLVAPGQQTSGIGQTPGVPAAVAAPVNLVHDWGIEIPGSDFTKPLGTSVRAMGVGFQGAESAGEFVDSHMSLGIMATTSEEAQVLVASDAQRVLDEPRPVAPGRVIVGRVPEFGAAGTPALLAAGGSLFHGRRLYLTAGPSVGGQNSSQTTDVFNQMYFDRSTTISQTYGAVAFATFGTALRSGALQTEIRFERYLAPAVFDPASDLNDGSRWMTERVEYLERGEAFGTAATFISLLPAIPETSADGSRNGHNQIYRVIVRNRNEGGATPFLKFTNRDAARLTALPDYLEPREGKLFFLRESLAPERNNAPYAVDDVGNVVNFRRVNRYFASRDYSGAGYVRQPMRMVVAGLDASGGMDVSRDPNLMRTKHWTSVFYPIGEFKRSPGDLAYGGVNFRAGNETFGTGFPGAGFDTFMAAPFELPVGQSFRALAIRGPLSTLQIKDFNTDPIGEAPMLTLLFENSKPPAGWYGFDMPGPSLATGGGMHPMEQLAGAVAEDIKVVGRAELDRNVSGASTYSGFRTEFTLFDLPENLRAPLGEDPLVVGARASSLGDGPVTALFPPDPAAAGKPALRASTGWTLADFIHQAEGQYNIVHRPMGPGGLFKVKNYSLSDPLGSGANAWWTATDPLSGGKKMGDFDALELLRGESLSSQTAAQWHGEYKELRAFWLKIVSAQAPAAFTKALGLSSAKYSHDTPVGLARTYLKVPTAPVQSDLTGVLAALKSGAAVASTGPMLEVDVNGTTGPGQLLTGSNGSVTLNITLTAPDWVPVEQVRVYVNGSLAQILNPAAFAVDSIDARRRSTSIPGLVLSQDSCIVVEAGAPDAGPTLGSAPWNALYPVWFKLQRGIYPLAISNPIFVDQNGGGYTPPGN